MIHDILDAQPKKKYFTIKGGIVYYINLFFSRVSPKELTHGIKISTSIHIGILAFMVIAPFIIPHHKYKGFKPSSYTVQLVSLPGTAVKNIPSITQPAPPKQNVPAVKQEIPKTKPKDSIKKTEMVIPSKKQKPKPQEKTPTLEEKLNQKLKSIEKTTAKPKAEEQWKEPDNITKTAINSRQEFAVTGTLGTSGTLGISSPSDFPFQYYLELIHGKISSCWTNPEMTIDRQYTAIISFIILKSGDIRSVSIRRSSGINNFDQSGLRAIELAKPFPQLPPGYNYSELTVNVEFALE